MPGLMFFVVLVFLFGSSTFGSSISVTNSFKLPEYINGLLRDEQVIIEEINRIESAWNLSYTQLMSGAWKENVSSHFFEHSGLSCALADNIKNTDQRELIFKIMESEMMTDYAEWKCGRPLREFAVDVALDGSPKFVLECQRLIGLARLYSSFKPAGTAQSQVARRAQVVFGPIRKFYDKEARLEKVVQVLKEELLSTYEALPSKPIFTNTVTMLRMTRAPMPPPNPEFVKLTIHDLPLEFFFFIEFCQMVLPTSIRSRYLKFFVKLAASDYTDHARSKKILQTPNYTLILAKKEGLLANASKEQSVLQCVLIDVFDQFLRILICQPISYWELYLSFPLYMDANPLVWVSLLDNAIKYEKFIECLDALISQAKPEHKIRVDWEIQYKAFKRMPPLSQMVREMAKKRVSRESMVQLHVTDFESILPYIGMSPVGKRIVAEAPQGLKDEFVLVDYIVAHLQAVLAALFHKKPNEAVCINRAALSEELVSVERGIRSRWPGYKELLDDVFDLLNGQVLLLDAEMSLGSFLMLPSYDLNLTGDLDDNVNLWFERQVWHIQTLKMKLIVTSAMPGLQQFVFFKMFEKYLRTSFRLLRKHAKGLSNFPFYCQQLALNYIY